MEVDHNTIEKLTFDIVKKATNKEWAYDKILYETGIEVM